MDELRSSGTKLRYEINSNLNSPGGFNPNTNTIQFKSTSDINYNTVLEEFYHAYQHYKVGIGKYMNEPPYKGRSNIEFEAKLYHDITMAITQPDEGFTYFGGFGEYSNWIFEITENWTRYPSWEQMQSEYYRFLEEFIQYNPNYNYPIDYELKPDTLLDLFGR